MSKHLARIGRVDAIKEIPGADNIQTAVVYGFETIVLKSVKVGDIGVFFEAGDTQLSDEFCKNNNLYRHSEFNIDVEKKGYIEDNRRLRVQKFLKVKSEGLFMSLNCLQFTNGDTNGLKFGDAFEEFNGIKICNKFINKNTDGAIGNRRKVRNVQTPIFHQHIDTEQLAYYIDTIPIGSLLTISHKTHGTSQRVTNTEVIRLEPKRTEKTSFYNNRLIKTVKYEEGESRQHEFVAGSRRVVLLDEHIEKEGFHGSEAWRFEILESFKPYLEKNMTIYMEVLGYVNGSPIMGSHDVTKLGDKRYVEKYGKSIVYKYGCTQDQYKVQIYRISITNPDGMEVDFSPMQLNEWCKKRNFDPVLSLVPSFFYDGDKERLMDLVKTLAEREDKLCEDYLDPSHINEGVVIRVDSGKLIPDFYKYKTFPFKLMEGIVKENPNFVDVEDAS